MKFARLRKRKTQSELAKEYRTKIKRIKKIQKERIREAKKLRDKGKINEMKKKITDWKKRGYNTSMMELKLGSLSHTEMKSLVDKWRKKYRY